jgi:predicted PurR-regulated permease PerM
MSKEISVGTGTMIRFILVLLGFFLIWYLRDLVMVIVTSIVVASFMESSVPFLKKVKLGRVFGMVLIYILLLILLAVGFYLFAPLLITELYNLSVFLATYVPDVQVLNFFSNEMFSGAQEIVSNLTSDFSVGSLLSVSEAFLENLSDGFFKTISVAFGGIFNFILIFVISFYLSIQDKGIEKFLRIILPRKYEDYVVDLWTRSEKKIGVWIKSQVLIGFLVGLIIYIILSLFNVKYALILAILAGVMEMIPYGIWVALIPAFSFTYVASGINIALFVLAIYIVVHQFEIFVMTPLLIKKFVGLSPLVVILALLIGYELAGVWGIIISIPVAVVLMEFMGDLEKKKALIKNN